MISFCADLDRTGAPDTVLPVGVALEEPVVVAHDTLAIAADVGLIAVPSATMRSISDAGMPVRLRLIFMVLIFCWAISFQTRRSLTPS